MRSYEKAPLSFRKPSLYPAELRDHPSKINDLHRSSILIRHRSGTKQRVPFRAIQVVIMMPPNAHHVIPNEKLFAVGAVLTVFVRDEPCLRRADKKER